MRILVVNDDTVQCCCIAAGLRQEGFDVAGALSGDEALELLDRFPVQVAVVDLMMPGMSGLALGREIIRRYADVYVVLTSAWHLSQRQLELAGLRNAACLHTPFTIERLGSVVRQRPLPSLEPRAPA